MCAQLKGYGVNVCAHVQAALRVSVCYLFITVITSILVIIYNDQYWYISRCVDKCNTCDMFGESLDIRQCYPDSSEYYPDRSIQRLPRYSWKL